MEKKYSCEIIKDLLPMYQDNVCSKESRDIVEEHLKECTDCATLAGRLQNNAVEDALRSETQTVLAQHAKTEKRRSTQIGIITSVVLMIPVIVCLICNLAVGHALNWFFIVLASLVVFASLSVVPLLVTHNRVLWTICSFTLSLVALLGVIALYTHGNWFAVAVVPSLYGLTLFFLPLVLYKLNLPGVLKEMKGFICMFIDTAFTYLLLFTCGAFVNGGITYNRIAYSITTVCAIFAWILFLIIRYFKISAFSRAGIVTILCGIFSMVINPFIEYVITLQWEAATMPNLFHWTLKNMQSNIFSLIFGCCLLCGIFLIALGINKSKKVKNSISE